MAPVELADKPLSVDRQRVGVCYASVGMLAIVDLGCAQALKESGIRPHAIAGVGMGALVALAHGIDLASGQAIDFVGRVVSSMTLASFGFTWEAIGQRVAQHGTAIVSVGDHLALRQTIRDILRDEFGKEDPTLDSIVATDTKVLVAATDLFTGNAYWFPGTAPLDDVLLASVALPGLLPSIIVDDSDGSRRMLIDGSIVWQQPLSVLALEGCGTIYSCCCTQRGEVPRNAAWTALRAVELSVHQAVRLEEAWVRTRLGNSGAVHHLHPPVSLPPVSDLSSELLDRVRNESSAATVRWLTEHGLTVPTA